MPVNTYDGNTLHEALEQATLLFGVKPLMAFSIAAMRYRGPGVQI